MRKMILEVDNKLMEGEVMIYHNGKVASTEVHRLLPDLKTLKNKVAELENEIEQLKNNLVELAKVVKEM